MMNFLQDLLARVSFVSYLYSAARGLLIAVPVALLFELAGWLFRSWLLRRLAPVYGRDAQRDPTTRARRRRLLRDYTVALARLVQNTAALLTILILWKVDPVAAALVLVALALLARQPLADAVATWSLVADDALATGDEVTLQTRAGELSGTVAEVGPRRVKLLEAGGAVHWVRCGDIALVRQVVPPAAPGDARHV